MTNRLARILQHRNIQTISYPLSTLRQQLRQVKDALGLKIPGECGAIYIGQTGRLISTRITEHKRHLQLGQSAVAQHCWSEL